jgi:hypothetical protein
MPVLAEYQSSQAHDSTCHICQRWLAEDQNKKGKGKEGSKETHLLLVVVKLLKGLFWHDILDSDEPSVLFIRIVYDALMEIRTEMGAVMMRSDGSGWVGAVFLLPRSFGR